MQLALIPPFAHSHEMWKTSYRMVLPVGLQEDERYTVTVHKAASDIDTYSILDNGIIEGGGTDADNLHAFAHEFGIDELVITDFPGNGPATYQAIEEWGSLVEPDRFNYMAVLQGASPSECLSWAELLSSISWITTLGIPRSLIDRAESRYARIKTAKLITASMPDRWQVHFLGASVQYPTEILELAQELQGVRAIRGIDTSMPFYYAMQGLWIRDIYNYVARPEGYFDMKVRPNDLNILNDNIAILKAWSQGRKRPEGTL